MGQSHAQTDRRDAVRSAVEPSFQIRQAPRRTASANRLNSTNPASPVEGLRSLAPAESKGVSKSGLGVILCLVCALGGLTWFKLDNRETDRSDWTLHTPEKVVRGQSPESPAAAPAQPSWASAAAADPFAQPARTPTRPQPAAVGIQLASHETEDPFAAPRAPSQGEAAESAAPQGLFDAPAQPPAQPHLTPAQRARSLAPIMTLDQKAPETNVRRVEHVEQAAEPFGRRAVAPLQHEGEIPGHHRGSHAVQPASGWDLTPERAPPAGADRGMTPMRSAQPNGMAPAQADPFDLSAPGQLPTIEPRPLQQNDIPAAPPMENRGFPPAQKSEPYYADESPTPASSQLPIPAAQPVFDIAPATARSAPKNQTYSPQPNKEAAPQEEVYQVQQGDNYWTISRKFYGSARFFGALGEYNKHRIPRPEKMKAGMIVLVPAVEVLHQRYPEMTGGVPVDPLPSGFFVDPQGPAFRVGEGDTLSNIAEKHLGRTARWTQIYAMNRQQIPNKDALKIGTVLRLPADASQILLAPDDNGGR